MKRTALKNIALVLVLMQLSSAALAQSQTSPYSGDRAGINEANASNYYGTENRQYEQFYRY